MSPWMSLDLHGSMKMSLETLWRKVLVAKSWVERGCLMAVRSGGSSRTRSGGTRESQCIALTVGCGDGEEVQVSERV